MIGTGAAARTPGTRRDLQATRTVRVPGDHDRLADAGAPTPSGPTDARRPGVSCRGGSRPAAAAEVRLQAYGRGPHRRESTGTAPVGHRARRRRAALQRAG